jgi:hypothetical protein
MNKAPPTNMLPSGESLLSEYEELRRVALTPSNGLSRGVGFSLLLRRGMAVWMDACAAVAPPPRSQAVPRQKHRLVPSELRSEVALVLAAMAMANPSYGGMTV